MLPLELAGGDETNGDDAEYVEMRMYRGMFGTMADAVRLSLTAPDDGGKEDDAEIEDILGGFDLSGTEGGGMSSDDERVDEVEGDEGEGVSEGEWEDESVLAPVPHTPERGEDWRLRRAQIEHIVNSASGSKRHKMRKRGGTRHPGEVIGTSGGTFTEALSRNCNKPYQIGQAIATLRRALDTDPTLSYELLEIVMLMLFSCYEEHGVVYLSWESRRVVYSNLILCPPTYSAASRWLLDNFVLVRTALRAWVAFCADETPAVGHVARTRYDWSTYCAISALVMDAMLIRIRTLGIDVLLKGLHDPRPQPDFAMTGASDYTTLRTMCGGVFARIPTTLPETIIRRLSERALAARFRIQPGETIMLADSSARRRSGKRLKELGDVAHIDTDERGYKSTTTDDFMHAADDVIQKVYYRTRHGVFWSACLKETLRISALRRLVGSIEPSAREPEPRIIEHRIPSFDPFTYDPLPEGPGELVDDWPLGTNEPAWRTVGDEPRNEYGSHPVVFAFERLWRRVYPDHLARSIDHLLLFGMSPRAVDAINSARTLYEGSTQKSAPFRFLTEVLDRFEFNMLLHFLKAQARRLQLRFMTLPKQSVREQLDALCKSGKYASHADIPSNAGVLYFCRGCSAFATGIYSPLDRRRCDLSRTTTGATNCNFDPASLHVYCRNGDTLTNHTGMGTAVLPNVKTRFMVAQLSSAASMLMMRGHDDRGSSDDEGDDKGGDVYERAMNMAMRSTIASAQRKADRPDAQVAALLARDRQAQCYNQPMMPVSLIGYAVRVLGQKHVIGAPASPTGEVYMMCPCSGAGLHLAHFHPDAMVGTSYRCVGSTIRAIAAIALSGPVRGHAPSMYVYTGAVPTVASLSGGAIVVGETAPRWMDCIRCTVPCNTGGHSVVATADKEGVRRMLSQTLPDLDAVV